MRFTAEFTAADYAAGRVTTLAGYREREQRLLDQVRTDIAKRLVAADLLPCSRFAPGSLSDPNVWTFNLTRRIAALASKGPVRDLPSILAFVSTVDSTVQVPAVIDSFMAGTP